MARTELQGQGISPGVRIGCAVSFDHAADEILRIPIVADAVEGEVARLHRAAEAARGELETLRADSRGHLPDELHAIFEAQELLLQDRSLLGRIEERIRMRQINAEWAVHRVEQDLRRQFEDLDVGHLRERVDDLRDVARLLRRALGGVEAHDLAELGRDVVLVARDLTPSEAVRLGRKGVCAFALETGGPTSHTAIIARSLHLPVVAGLTGLTDLSLADTPLLVDGDRGRVLVEPDPAEREEALARRRAGDLHAREMAATRSLPAETRDGVAIRLMVNIDLIEELEEARQVGAAGVGLYRSEFLYIEKSPELPSEDEQVDVYRALVDASRPHPAIIRTFDLGGRKLAREVLETQEENPVLGLRGVRLTLARPEIFRHQIRALLRAAAGGDLWVMVPMVTAIEEIRAFRSFVEHAADELTAEGVEHSRDFPLGAMIEVPAAAVIADRIAREVDFLSIGSNDLIQYSLAVDRNNEHVAHLYQPHHPAVLRMLRGIVDAAARADVPLSLCGEMAGDPAVTPLLLGLGLTRLSVAPLALPEIKSRLRSLEVPTLRRVTERPWARRPRRRSAASRRRRRRRADRALTREPRGTLRRPREPGC
ncbi:MAG: phosphoenolpyruvate--protein phosphotransferase [Thermoanaerobaculia bacterium]